MIQQKQKLSDDNSPKVEGVVLSACKIRGTRCGGNLGPRRIRRHSVSSSACGPEGTNWEGCRWAWRIRLHGKWGNNLLGRNAPGESSRPLDSEELHDLREKVDCTTAHVRPLAIKLFTGILTVIQPISLATVIGKIISCFMIQFCPNNHSDTHSLTDRLSKPNFTSLLTLYRCKFDSRILSNQSNPSLENSMLILQNRTGKQTSVSRRPSFACW